MKSQYFEWLGSQLGFKELDDWYGVTKEDITKNGGISLMKYYNSSPSRALRTVFPEHHWQLWRFKKTPNGYWKKEGTHKEFFDWLQIQLGIKEMDDWYKVTLEEVHKYGGKELIQAYYSNSISTALQSIYPFHTWTFWKYNTSLAFNLWPRRKNQEEFFRWLGKTLGFQAMEDWYKITKEDIYHNGGRELLNIYYGGDPAKALKSIYPEHNWIWNKSIDKN